MADFVKCPHLLAPVVTDPRKAVVALKWAVREMEERYQSDVDPRFRGEGVRGVEAFNERVRAAKDKGEKLKRTVHPSASSGLGTQINSSS